MKQAQTEAGKNTRGPRKTQVKYYGNTKHRLKIACT